MCKKDRITTVTVQYATQLTETNGDMTNPLFDIHNGSVKYTVDIKKRSSEQLSKSNRYLMRVHQFFFDITNFNATYPPDSTFDNRLFLSPRQPFSYRSTSIVPDAFNTFIGLVEGKTSTSFDENAIVVENIFDEPFTLELRSKSLYLENELSNEPVVEFELVVSFEPLD
jgi:hypothetical protein